MVNCVRVRVCVRVIVWSPVLGLESVRVCVRVIVWSPVLGLESVLGL